jgi:hypothetical protein
MNVYDASFRRLVAQLEEQGHSLSHSILTDGIWTVIINPKPLCVFRVRFDASTKQLSVSRRKPFVCRELLRRTLTSESLDVAIREALALIGPFLGSGACSKRPSPMSGTTEPGWPELRQFADLTEDDFVRRPVWVNCHMEDYEHPWHEQTDEETFRPWMGVLPVSASEGMLLVRAVAQFLDGSHHAGFMSLAFVEGDLGMIQPHVFINGQQFGFWGGGPGISVGWRQKFYEATGKEPEEIFPIRFTTDAGLARGVTTCAVEGFYWLKGKRTVVER